MDPETFIDPQLTVADRLVLDVLLAEQDQFRKASSVSTPPVDSGYASPESSSDREDAATGEAAIGAHAASGKATPDTLDGDDALARITAMNDPTSALFEPTVFQSWDLATLRLPSWVDRLVLKPYVRWAATVVRVPTDVVMLTHLFIYASTLVPSAVLLFRHFTYLHAVAHWLFASWCVGAYTLMRHQHIHMRGVLAPAYAWLDCAFPYVLDPLIGHTWNSYFYHHVKHHHVEGNGPEDLSSTIRYQRDSPLHFFTYFARFALLVWLELPAYFIRKGKASLALQAAISEFSNYAMIYVATRINMRAAVFVFVLPLCMLRLGLMVGNWGQHALVDELEPDSDYRSSITLIDVPSNRFSFNDGYHTSHHLNARRHWREHPAAFLKHRSKYAAEHALVFRNIDYIFLTVRLLMKDYDTIAKCLVPIGPEQTKWTHADKVAMLKTKTMAMSEADIKKRFRKA